ERRDGRWTKVPIDPKSGGRASSTDPATWGTFEQAQGHCRRHGLAGIGFAFTKEDDIAGVDIDDCRDPATGEIDQEAKEIIEKLGSYSEISPSSTGVKVFLKGKLPAKGNRKGRVEMYDHGRFFAVTGRKLEGSPSRVLRRPKALARLHAQLFPPADRPV